MQFDPEFGISDLESGIRNLKSKIFNLSSLDAWAKLNLAWVPVFQTGVFSSNLNAPAKHFSLSPPNRWRKTWFLPLTTSHFDCGFGILDCVFFSITNPKSKFPNPFGDVAQRIQRGSVRRSRLEVRILSFPFFGFVAQRNQERKNSNLEVAGSNPAKAISISDLELRIWDFWSFKYFGFVQPAGRLTLDQEIEVRILNPKPNFFTTGCSADGKTGLPWEQVFAGSNPATRISFSKKCRRGLNGKDASFRNSLMWVRISPSVSVFFYRSGGI